jgi:hypothetical protein
MFAGGGGAGEDGVDDEVGVGGIQRAAGQEQAVVVGAQDHLGLPPELACRFATDEAITAHKQADEGRH